MKRIIMWTAILCFGWLGTAGAQATHDDFLGVPVPPGKEIQRTDARLELISPQTHDQVLNFYKEHLEMEKDIKIRNWKDQSYVEDDSNRPWHSITIDKEYHEGTKIVIVKDNWTWIIGTLLLRYVGVFVVLLVLMIGMLVSGKIISTSVRKQEEKKAG